MELLNLQNVMNVLEEYAIEVRNLYQDKLITDDRIASGELLNSVDFHVLHNGTEFEVQLTLRDYWKYLEYGIKGDANPSAPFDNPGWKAYPFILEWVKVKPVLPKPLHNGKLPEPHQLAYLITRSLVEKGRPPGNELKDTLEEVNARYRERLTTALQQDMGIILKVMLGDFMGKRPEL